MKSPESWSKNCIREYVNCWRGVQLHVTRQRSNNSIIGLKWPLDSSFTADFKVRTFQNGFASADFSQLWVYTSEGTKFCPIRNFKVDRGRSNICIFTDRFCKALVSLVIICRKKFLQESVDHPSKIQPPAAQSIWRFRTWWKLRFFTHYFYWSKLYAFEIKLFCIQRTEHYLTKSF